MIKKIAGEIWKQIEFKGHRLLRKKYAVSNHGQICSFQIDIFKDGKILKGSVTSGYKTINLHITTSNGTFYTHREVAKLFCTKNSPRQKFVIHKNHNKQDNYYKNLEWATLAESSMHQQNSPSKIAYKERQAQKTKGFKLSLSQVKIIKKQINNPNRRLTYKQMASKYHVSEMTLFRIKSGENWAKA